MQASLFEQIDATSPVATLDTKHAIEQGPAAPAVSRDITPAGLSFEDFRLRSIFGADGKIKDQALCRQAFPYKISVYQNQYANKADDKYGAWDMSVEAGRSYLVGTETPLKDFLRRYTSTMTPWQKLAFAWCTANPASRLILQSERPKLEYHICRRGEYVEIGLPHQDAGGEKHWISRDGLRKVLINVD
jgi:hypothetical protein